MADDFVENLHAPELFADACVVASSINGNLRLTFTSVRSDLGRAETVQPTQVVMSRLVMPSGAIDGLLAVLNE